jgi:hypothetical protein
MLEEERGHRRLEHRAEDIRVSGQPLELVLTDLPGVLGKPPPQVELLRDERAALSRDYVRAQPRKLPLREVRICLVERPRDRKLENAVPEELEPFVRLAPLRGPGGMGKDLREPLRRERVDQPLELAAVAVTGVT